MATRADGQLTGMAGEFLTLGQLFKRGYQGSVTLGTAKSIDLLVHNPTTDRNFNVQVKTLRAKNCFLIRKESIRPDHIYVFVLLNGVDKPEEYFIVRGKDILTDVHKFFGSSYKRAQPSSMPAINFGPLKEYRNNWKVFDAPSHQQE